MKRKISGTKFHIARLTLSHHRRATFHKPARESMRAAIRTRCRLLQIRHLSGADPSNWIGMDYNDVLGHILHPELRQRYAFEQLWGDAKRVK